jgi:purine-binding chemotaxis protein CheW
MANQDTYTDSRLQGMTMQLVGFNVGAEEYCIDILKVQEIIRMLPITAVPSTPEHVEGVINLRGKVIPIIDFRKRFRIAGEGSAAEQNRRIVVVTVGNATIGLIVDGVSQVVKFTDEQIAPAPPVTKGCDADAVVGVGKRGDKLVIILDVGQMFSAKDLTGLQGEC